MEDHRIFHNYLFVVRGTLFELPDPLLNVGFVPVHTVSTESHGSTVRVPLVHPRVCGYYFNPTILDCTSDGSSPCVRRQSDRCHSDWLLTDRLLTDWLLTDQSG